MDEAEQPRLPGVVVLRGPIGWAAVVDGYLAEISAQKAANTAAAYQRDLAAWGAWCSSTSIEPMAATRAHVIAYLEHLNRHGAAKSSVKRLLSPLRGVYDWAVAEDLLDRSPMARVKGPPAREESPTLGLSIDEVVDLLDAAQAAGPGQHALVQLLFANGLRASEVCGADVADLRTITGRRTIRITRKGGKQAIEALSAVTARVLDEHLAGRRTGPLFVSPTGLRMYRQQVRRLVIRLATTAGIPTDHITSHSLRHTFVTQGLEAGASLESLQDAAGHADPATTRGYDRARHQLAKHPTDALTDFLETARAARRPHGTIPGTDHTWEQLRTFE